VSTGADTLVAPWSVSAGQSPASPFDNRFLVVAVACQRVTQIRNGARPRLPPDGHKPCVMAVAEVVAGTVAYTVA
jgi:DNA-directed RNA polymerase subunit K/omega